MLMSYGVGCAYVFVGAWSYFVTSSAPTFFVLDIRPHGLNGCFLTATKLTNTYNCLT